MAANAAPGADDIVFDATVFNSVKTITLASGEIAITGPLTITGPTATLTISGNKSSRIFNINDSVSGTAIAVSIKSLTLTKGVTSGVNNGGAIFIQDENVTLTNCTLTGNSSAALGGAIRQEAGGSLTITNCVLSTNTSTSVGGALSLVGGPTVTISNSTFVSNIGTAGGAINMPQGGSVAITGSTFNFNQATTGQGGGIFLNGSMSSVIIRNCTVHSNVAALSGGGVMFGSLSTGSLTIQNSTITSNNASGGDGGGVARGGGSALITITSTIVFGNLASTTADDLFSTGQINATKSLIGTAAGVTTFSPDAFTNTNLGVNPNLESLQNNGGITLTRMPSATSIAIDNGANPGALTTDQRGTGFPRQRGSGVDIGAVEVHRFVVTNTNANGVGSLLQATLDANAASGQIR